MEVDTSPFVADDPTSDLSKILEKQAEIFLGKRNKFSGWTNPAPAAWKEEQKDNVPPAKPDLNFIDLTVLGSSNPLFPGKNVEIFFVHMLIRNKTTCHTMVESSASWTPSSIMGLRAKTSTFWKQTQITF